jgi:hypothetical protein
MARDSDAHDGEETDRRLVGGWEGRYYEDFAVGDVYKHPYGRTATETDDVWFTNLSMNLNPMHFNEAYAAETEFGETVTAESRPRRRPPAGAPDSRQPRRLPPTLSADPPNRRPTWTPPSAGSSDSPRGRTGSSTPTSCRSRSC